MFVLCTGDGNAAAIEPVHIPHTVCITHSAHTCHRSDGATEEITHNHVSCKDIPLRLNQGQILDRERLQVVFEAESYQAEALDRSPSGALLAYPIHDVSLQHLRSVVLLI